MGRNKNGNKLSTKPIHPDFLSARFYCALRTSQYLQHTVRNNSCINCSCKSPVVAIWSAYKKEGCKDSMSSSLTSIPLGKSVFEIDSLQSWETSFAKELSNIRVMWDMTWAQNWVNTRSGTVHFDSPPTFNRNYNRIWKCLFHLTFVSLILGLWFNMEWFWNLELTSMNSRSTAMSHLYISNIL